MWYAILRLSLLGLVLILVIGQILGLTIALSVLFVFVRVLLTAIFYISIPKIILYLTDMYGKKKKH